jgi:predicted DsbA family dithiol-disulfide isomerase
MTSTQKPLQIIVYQDVLCAWSYLAESRLAPLRDELRDLVRWLYRPFPLRAAESRLTEADLHGFAEEIRKASDEPDGRRLVPDLWISGDPPRSSVPALAALEAARLQGHHARSLLCHAMQRAALEQGVNVSRPDVVLELAARVGLDMNRFSAAFHSSKTERLIIEEHRLASGRGVRKVPTLVIAGRWMISGLRETREYREHVLDCLHKVGQAEPGARDRILH